MSRPKRTKHPAQRWICAVVLAAALGACQSRDLATRSQFLAGADLTVTSATLDKTEIAPGLVVASSCAVANIGTGLAEASQLNYYLSTDAVYDASDRYLNYDSIDELAPGSSSPETANLRIPAGTAFGDYYILFVADQKEQVDETSESNNIVAIPIKVIDPDAPVSTGPDLVITQAQANPFRAEADEQVEISVVVKNQGQNPAAASRIKYYFSLDTTFDASDVYRNYDSVPSLASGEESAEVANVRIPAGTPTGVYYVLIVADVDGVVPETVEDNNVTAVQVAVGDIPIDADPPDLVPYQATMTSDTWSPGEELLATTVIKNNGGIAGAVDSNIRYYLSRDTLLDEFDKQLSFNKVTPIETGGTQIKEDTILRIPESTNGGAWYVLFIVDADGNLAESNETNNVLALPLTVALDTPEADGPDLVPQDVTLDTKSVLPGGVISVSCVVKNVGNLPAGESRLKYFLSPNTDYESSDTYLNYDNVPALAPDASVPEGANVRIPLNTTLGKWYLLLVADHTKEVAENIESNNVVAVEITVTDSVPDEGGEQGGGDKPDLVVTDIALESTSVRAGERLSASLAIQNIGVSDAPGSRVKYYLSRDAVYDPGVDKYVGYDTVDALTSGQKSPEAVTPLVPEDYGHGTWHLLMVADANGEVEEAREDNNIAAVPFTVLVDEPNAERPDLLVVNASLDAAAYAPNSKVTLSYKVINDGVLGAPPSRVKLYWSANNIRDADDEFLTYRDVPALAVGQEAGPYLESLRVPHHAPEGEYYLLVVADGNDTVEESFESNNIKVLNVTVSASGKAPGVYPFACPSYINNDVTVYERGAIASFNALHLGYENKKDMPAMACVTSHFRLVGLQEIETEQGVIDLVNQLEAITPFDWDYHISPTEVGDEFAKEYYAYIWRTDSVTFLGSAGFFPDPNDYVKREPYGANFRIGNFDFTFVVFHQRKGNALSDTRAEAIHLKEIYDHFQGLDPNENDIIIGGDFNLPGDDPAYTIVGHDGVTYVVDPEQKTSISEFGLINSYDNFFYPTWAFTELRDHGVLDFTLGNHDSIRRTVSDHIPVWIVVDTTTDDD